MASPLLASRLAAGLCFTLAAADAAMLIFMNRNDATSRPHCPADGGSPFASLDGDSARLPAIVPTNLCMQPDPNQQYSVKAACMGNSVWLVTYNDGNCTSPEFNPFSGETAFTPQACVDLSPIASAMFGPQHTAFGYVTCDLPGQLPNIMANVSGLIFSEGGRCRPAAGPFSTNWATFVPAVSAPPACSAKLEQVMSVVCNDDHTGMLISTECSESKTPVTTKKLPLPNVPVCSDTDASINSYFGPSSFSSHC